MDFNKGELRIFATETLDANPTTHLDPSKIAVINFTGASCFQVFHPAEDIPPRPVVSAPAPSPQADHVANVTMNLSISHFDVDIIYVNAGNHTVKLNGTNMTQPALKKVFFINNETQPTLVLTRGQEFKYVFNVGDNSEEPIAFSKRSISLEPSQISMELMSLYTTTTMVRMSLGAWQLGSTPTG